MLNRKIFFSTTALIMTGAVNTAFAQDAQAQVEETGSLKLNTVTVSVSKRDQTLQDAPVAVSVVDTSTIERASLNDILDLQTIVPSLRTAQLQQSGNTSFFIRGFGNGSNNPGIEPSVAVFIDGVYRSRSAGAIGDFPDVKRVEVLRGPQSTLFGKNASVGVVSFVTAEPTDEWSGAVEGTLGNYNQMLAKGFVSGPLSETVGVSLSGSTHKRDGYAENLTGPDLNDRDRYALRGQALFEPNDDLKVRVIADYDQLDEICCYSPVYQAGPATAALLSLGGVTPVDQPYEYRTALDRTPENEIENAGVSGQVDYRFDWGTLTSITAYRTQDQLQRGDVDFTNLDAVYNSLETELDTFTQELRLAGSTERLDWLVGAYYFDESVKVDSRIGVGPAFRPFTNLISGGALAGFEQVLALANLPAFVPTGPFFTAGEQKSDIFEQDNKSYSIFAQGDFKVTEKLTATLGVALINDEKDVTYRGTVNEPFYQIELSNSPYADAIGQLVFAQVFEAVTQTPFSPTAVAGTPQPVLDAITAQAAQLTPAQIADVQNSLQFLSNAVYFPNAVEDGNTNDEEVTYTLRLAYDVNESFNVYANYSTGYKASSWNLTTNSAPLASDVPALTAAGLLTGAIPGVIGNFDAGTRFAGPEETTLIEIGMKASFERAAINVALFDQTVEGFQSTIFRGAGFVLSNAGEQSALGLEIDATWNPVDPLTLTLSGVFLDPEYDSFVGAQAVDANGNQVSADLSGAHPGGIHDVSVYTSAQYDFIVSPSATGFVRVGYQYMDEQPVVENVPGSAVSREVNSFDASLGFALDSGIDVTFWGRNITDDEYAQSAFPTVTQSGSFSGYPNQPRTYGMTVRKSW